MNSNSNKFLHFFALTAMLMVAATAAPAQTVTNFFQAVTNLNPAAYWPLQETAQPPTADVETNLGSFGTSLNAVYSSTNVAKNAAGIANGYTAVRFIGTNAGTYLAVPTASPQVALPVGPFSVEAWIYPSNVTSGLTIMAQTGPTTTPGLNGAVNGGGGWSLNQNYDPFTEQNTPGWSFHVYNGVGYFGGADALVITNYATNTWYHLVGVFDGTNASLYVNGVNVTSYSYPMPAGTSYNPDTLDFLMIGGGRGLGNNLYNGEIEEAAIYTNALTAGQILAHYNAASGSSSAYSSTILSTTPAGPVMYWRLNSPGNLAQSLSAYPVAVNYGSLANINGLYSSSTTPGSPGPAYAGMTNGFNVSGVACAVNGVGTDSTNQAPYFNNGVPAGSLTLASGVYITNLPPALNVLSNSFSLMYWFKVNMDDRRNGAFGHSDNNWRSSITPSGGEGQATANAGKGGDIGTTGSLNVNDGNWHFLTFVYTNTGALNSGGGWAGTNYLYIDGVFQTTEVVTNAVSTTSTTNILIGGAPDHNTFGNGNSYSEQAFSGKISHVAFFTNALQPAQVQSLYSLAGAPPLIQVQPSPIAFTNNPGTTNVLGAVTASGASTLVYHWYYNSTPSYSGATQLAEGQTASGSGDFGTATRQLTITNLGAADAGYYFVVITNSYGSVSSVITHQAVLQAPVISGQNPTGPFTAYIGQNNLGISVTVLGAGPFTYQWYTNGVADTALGTASAYPWTVQAGQAGDTFQCIVSDTFGTATSLVATLTTTLTVPAGAGNGAFQANLLGLHPAAYWPLQEAVQPPPAQIETNLGSLGQIADAYYSSTNVVPGVSGATGDGDAADGFTAATGSFLAIPQTNGVAIPVGPFTVEAWVYPTNNTSGTAQIIMSQSGAPGTGGPNGGANSAGWGLCQDYVPSRASASDIQGWSFHVFNGNGAFGGAEAVAPNFITLNTWYHIVGVFDGTNAYLYVDGTNAGTQLSPINGTYVQDTWDQTTIGCGGGGGALDADLYRGSIDEVAVYTNALSALQVSNHYAQVNNNYKSTILGDNPYMYWRMDAPAYTAPPLSAYPIAFNYGTAPNMNGIYFGGDVAGIAGPTNAGLGTSSLACSISGIGTSATNVIGFYMPNLTYNAYLLYTNSNTTVPFISSGILCTNEDASLCASNQPFTIACWFKDNPADQRFQNLFGAHADSGPRFAMSGGQLQFYTGAGGNLASGTYPNCNDGNWHFAVGVYTNSGTFATGASYLYVDGILVGSEAITSAQAVTLTNFPIMIGGDPERIDAGNGNGYNERFFSGSLAHMAYFTNALNPAQVVNLYTNATAGIPPQGPVITLQPTSGRTSGAGGNNGLGPNSYIFFGVNAVGASLSYQWYFNSSSNYNGTALVNGNKYQSAQTLQVTVSNLVNSDSGYYYVIITNSYGSATSILATLQVNLAPVITAQTPSGAFSLYPNQTATLSVTAGAGETPFSYQWYTNNGGGFVADAAAGTAASYNVSASSAVSGETYECIVTNVAGSATSAVNTVTIVPLPSNITNSAYASNVVVTLGATGYWPMHENEVQPLPGDVETNYGSLGAIANGYYQDWANPSVTHSVPGAIAGDSDGSVIFYNTNNTAIVVPHATPQLTLGTTNNPAFTLEAWVKPFIPGNTDGGTYMSIMGQGAGNPLNGGTSTNGFVLQYGGTADTFSLVVQNGVGGADYEQKTVASYPPGQWYHIVCEWTGTTVTYYVDGVQAGFLSGNPTATDNPQTLSPDTCSPFTIGGGRWLTTGATHAWVGGIDEVAVYTNLLTPQQIQNDYLAGTTVGSNYFQTVLGNAPLLYYRMDAPTYVQPPYSAMTAVLTNYGSVAQNGVYVPSAIPGSDAGPNNSTAFAGNMSGTNAMRDNGVMSFADAGFSPAWNPVTTTSFSYSAWFRGFPADDRTWEMMFSANDATWRASVNGNANTATGFGGVLVSHGNEDVHTTNTIVNDGNWHQWVTTCLAYLSNSTPAFSNVVYIDGLMVTNSWATGTNTPANKPGPEVLIGDEWGLTNDVTEGNGGRAFAGDICEAAFFNGTVLSAAQVQSLYNSAGMPPIITGQPVSGTAIVTLGFTNSVIARGAQPLYYQWYTNGVAIGSTATNISGMITNGVINPVFSNTLIINPVAVADAGSYFVVITNAYGAITSSVVNLTVLGTPIITNQFPVTYTNNFAVYAGANPAFTVDIIGAPLGLGYFWTSNGVPIPGAGNASFTWTNVQYAFTNLNCVVSNFLGEATSIVWSAQVIADPVGTGGIGLAPYPQSVLALNPIGYWRMNDTNLDGVDGNDVGSIGSGNGDVGDNGYICHDYAGGNDGLYTNCTLNSPGYNPTTDPTDSSAQFGEVDLDNDFGDSDANSIAGTSFATPAGGNTAFTVEAWVSGFPQTSAAGIVTLGWGNGGEQYNLDTGSAGDAFRFFFRDASGATHLINSTIVPSAKPNTLGPWYHLVATVDEVHSNDVVFYINGVPVGSVALTSGLGVLATTNLMDIGARMSSATSTLNDQFLGDINDVAIFNYALTPAQVLSQYVGSGVPPFLAVPPTSTTNASGNGPLIIPAQADGTGGMTNWWTFAGANVFTGMTNGNILNAGLTVSNAPGNWNNGQLELTVSNAYGGTNVFVTLTIFTNAPQLSVGLPPQVNLLVNQAFTYSATVLGAAPLVYQWYSNSVAITGATNASFTPVTSSAGSTAYSLVITNTYGTATAPSTLTVFAAPSDSYGASILGLKPVGYWPLQETGAAAPATIETNYGSLGALGNAYYAITTANETNVLFNQPGALSQSGNNDSSVQFGGPSGTNYAFIPRLAPQLKLTAPFSMETWIYSGSAAFSDLISEQGNGLNGVPAGGNWGGPRLCYGGNNSGGANLQFYVATGSGTTRPDVGTPANSLPLNTWHHCVATYDGTNTVLYIDNVVQYSGTGLSGANTMSPDSSTPLTIGDGLWTGTSTGPQRSFYGSMDEVAIYTNILTAAQVQNHYLAAINTGSNYFQTVMNDNPLLYYHMDCAGYTNPATSLYPSALNFGSAPVNGTYLPGTRPGFVSGPPIVTLATNVASPINGITACIDAGYNSAFNWTNAFTALGWFKGNPGDSRWQSLMSHGANWALVLIGTNGTVALTNAAGIATSTTIVNDGNWHFVAGVYDGSNNNIYVDGVLSTRASAPGILTSDATHDIYLGGEALYTVVGVNQTYFGGAIAQAAFFTNALTAAQIQSLYNLATIPPGLRVSLGPPSVTVYSGATVPLTAQASGTAPFYYQWYQGASPIGNATNATYRAVAVSGSTTYSCIVSNAYNGYTSTNAGPVTLVGIAPPTNVGITNLYQATVWSNNPIAFWRLNEGPDNTSGNDGTVAYDYAGGHNGIYTNVELGLAGFSLNSTDTAALFGPSNNVQAAANSFLGEIYSNGLSPVDFTEPNGSNAEFSAEAWVKSTGANGLNTPTIVAKGHFFQEEFALDAGAAGSYRFEVRSAAGTAYNANSTVSLSSTNQWYHLVGVCDEANGLVSLYIDGQLTASTAIPVASGITNSSGTPTSIGARSSTVVAGYDQQFPGYISDVALYNYVLSPTQIAADYAAGTATVSTVGFTNAPPISFSTANNQLMLNWPSKYAGYYYLEVQTNTLSTGIGNNWVPYGGSVGATLTVSGITNTINTANGCVFYRLMTNAP